MRKRYDFSKASPNPYAKRLTRSVPICMDEPTLARFRALADESGIPFFHSCSTASFCSAGHRRFRPRPLGTGFMAVSIIPPDQLYLSTF